MLQLETIENAYSFHSYDQYSAKLVKPNVNIHSNASSSDDFIEIASTALVYKDKLVTTDLPTCFDELSSQFIDSLQTQEAELFVVGTGSCCRFPHKSLLQHIAAAELAIDFMDTGAALRTYNILTTEYRKVAALIFFK